MVSLLSFRIKKFQFVEISEFFSLFLKLFFKAGMELGELSKTSCLKKSVYCLLSAFTQKQISK